jgi:hypothetical protein
VRVRPSGGHAHGRSTVVAQGQNRDSRDCASSAQSERKCVGSDSGNGDVAEASPCWHDLKRTCHGRKEKGDLGVLIG